MSENNSPDFKEKTAFLQWQLMYIIDQIKMADYKINFLLTIYLALLGVTVTQIGKMIKIFRNPYIYLLLKISIGGIVLIFLYCIVKFFICFINTVKPRMNVPEILGQGYRKSSIFWKDVSNIDYENFENISLKTNYEDMIKEILVNSNIAKVKFENVASAYNLLMPTIIIFLILFSLVYYLNGG